MFAFIKLKIAITVSPKPKRGEEWKKNVWLREINFNNIQLIETFLFSFMKALGYHHQLQRCRTFALTPARLLHTQSNLQINFLLVQHETREFLNE